MASINRRNEMTLLKSRSTFIFLAMLKCLQHAVHVPHVTVVGYYVSYLKVWTIATFDISLRPNCHTPSFFFFSSLARTATQKRLRIGNSGCGLKFRGLSNEVTYQGLQLTPIIFYTIAVFFVHRLELSAVVTVFYINRCINRSPR